jgi:hypothetical protein
VKEGFLFNRVDLQPTHIPSRYPELSTDIRAHFTDAVASLVHPAAVPAGKTANGTIQLGVAKFRRANPGMGQQEIAQGAHRCFCRCVSHWFILCF